MRADIYDRLQSVRQIEREGKKVSCPPCKMCQGATFEFDVVDFRKFCNNDPYAHGFSRIPVYYFRCSNCDCVFTDFFDDWTSADFSLYIYNDDYLKVDPDYFGRPVRTAQEWSSRFSGFGDMKALDYGSGSGLFARELNAVGFNFKCYDPFSDPVEPEGKFDVVVSFEVIEHSIDPVQTFERMFDFLSEEKIVIFGQSLQPDDIMSQKGNWWYLSPRNGHATTYSFRTFKNFCSDRDLLFYHSPGLYGISSKDLSPKSEAFMRRVGERA